MQRSCSVWRAVLGNLQYAHVDHVRIMYPEPQGYIHTAVPSVSLCLQGALLSFTEWVCGMRRPTIVLVWLGVAVESFPASSLS